MTYRTNEHKALTATRKKIAWDLSMRFYSHREIAKELGMSHRGVGKMLEKMLAEYHEHFMEDIDKVKQLQVQAIMMAARESWDSWVKSKQVGPFGEHLNNQYGDIKYLKAYLDCLAEIRKILGCDAAIKFNLGIDVNQLSEEDLKRLSAAESPSDITP